MHPHLENLKAQYEQLLDRVERGEITVEQAVEALGHMSVSDADGYEWQIDPDGSLTRRMPGAAAELADASQFAASDANGGVAPSSVIAPSADLDPVGGSDAPLDLFESFAGAAPSLATPPQRVSGSDDELHMFEPARPQVERDRRSLDMSRGLDLVRRYRGALIVVACVLFIVVSLGVRQRSTDNQNPTVDAGTAPTNAVDTTVSSSPAVTEPQPVVLDGESIKTVLGELSSGDRKRVGQIAPDPKDARSIALRAAQYAGYRAIGLELNPGKTTDGVATVALMDGEETLAKFVVTITLRDGVAVLAAWPEPAR